jgi:hypothetical protein
MAGGYVVTILILQNETDTTYQFGILQAQAWRLLAQSGAGLRRNKHDRISIKEGSGAGQANR